MRKDYLWIGAICTAFFLFAAIGNLAVAWWNFDGSFEHPRASAVAFALFWLFWASLGVWMLLAYFWERLVITTNNIRKIGWFRTRSLRQDEITTARWRLLYGDGGSLVVKSANAKIVVHFEHFTKAERAELRTIFRTILHESIQENWQKYEQRFVTRPPPDPRMIRRIRYVLSAVFVTFAACFALLAFAGIGNFAELIVVALLNVLASVWLVKQSRTAQPP
jgi:hypothetical protein